ncbi:MAG: rhodanese-like domain-containing protein [Planctomycetota bacterium]|nr:rhodanese-like domain-containing protein [Planctomycetota bacterium]MEC8817579.1 rhodanese-like domain-containing protein [Planctomycetota bacterium]MEC9158768.1 rhodanese-like domain-containing protein [Planctomycetota bacterium]MEC9232953.1 rhodanese-like domain-containing protein [Planctomycetota bacterium]
MIHRRATTTPRRVPRTGWLLPLLLVGSALTGCKNSTSDKDLKFVNSTRAIELLEVRTGAFGSRGTRVNVWLDPRTLAEYEKAHIPGAISMPFPRIEQDAKSRLINAATIIVYDTDWDDVIGVSASKRLMELGYSEVYTLRGGIEAWVADGHGVASGPPTEAIENQAGRR